MPFGEFLVSQLVYLTIALLPLSPMSAETSTAPVAYHHDLPFQWVSFLGVDLPQMAGGPAVESREPVAGESGDTEADGATRDASLNRSCCWFDRGGASRPGNLHQS